MCLIVYSPTGELLERRVFDDALVINPDGIGVMSPRGVEKFLGKKSAKKAWRYLRRLGDSRIPHGIHFRLATHGDVTRYNCHPFYAPNSDAIVMHNGILRLTAELATTTRSDTAIFVERYMSSAPGPADAGYTRFYRRLGRRIGLANKLLVYHALTEQFTICNESAGEWVGRHWYSNDYSLPWGLAYGFGVNWHTSVLSEDYSGTGVNDPVSDLEAYYAALIDEPDYFDLGAKLGTPGRREWDHFPADTDDHSPSW